MTAGHIVVAVLTAISIAILVWIEIRSRRNIAAEEQAAAAGSVPLDQLPPPLRHRRKG